MRFPTVRQKIFAATLGWLMVSAVGSFKAAENPVEAPPATLSRILIGQPVSPGEEGRWVEAEGMVTFIGKRGEGLSLELSSGGGHMQVTVAEADEALAPLLVNSRIRVSGLCLGIHNWINGEMVGAILAPSQKDVVVQEAPQETWERYPIKRIAALSRARPINIQEEIVHLEGQLGTTNADGTFNLTDRTGRIRLRTPQNLPMEAGAAIEVLGVLGRAGSDGVVLGEISRLTGGRKKPSSVLPVLTRTETVRWLKAEEANRRYPVKLRAVVTFVLATGNEFAGNLQDGTGGIYAWHLTGAAHEVAVKPGDYCEVEGETSAGEFSPGIDCRQIKMLGPGQFPEPRRPSWDELASGSLDAQWVEISGIALSAAGQHLEIGTQGGRVACFVAGAESLDRFLNAIVRVRGVVVADWDQARHVRGLHLNLPSADFISIDTPPQANPFSLPTRRIKDLLFYNPGESAFRREKVMGQIVGLRAGVGYLTDGTNGLRLNLEGNTSLAPGDVVEAAGFPEIDNSIEPPLITLRETVTRVTGHKPLPTAAQIASVNLLGSEHDSTFVRLEARLVRQGIYGADQVLELQANARTFFAGLPVSAGMIPHLPAGSRVAIAGVYVFNDGRPKERMEAGPLELLLGSLADVRVLELPSWWTSEHSLMVVSGMSLVILLALIWIGLLRQQVGRRTAQLVAANQSLEGEIAERKRTENELVRTRAQHLIEQERARIARDIHDELGSSLSQIRLLSEMSLSHEAVPSGGQTNSGKISAKALEATRVLDEIVWAVDPQNDTLESLLNYLFNFGSEYLSLAGIRFRIDAPTQIPHQVLTTQVRHQLYMAVKETFTNIVNHAGATEVWIRLQLEAGAVGLMIEDNGRGFDLPGRAGEGPGASGLDNMRQRFLEIGGDFVVESAVNRGTRVKFVVPLTKEAVS